MKRPLTTFVVLLAALAATYDSFAPPPPVEEPATNVSVSFSPSFDATGASVIATPTATTAVVDVTSGADLRWRQYQPGNVIYNGFIILERPVTVTRSNWHTWFEDTATGAVNRRNVILSYTGQGTTNVITWIDCLPARFEVAPGSGGTSVERLHLLVSRMD